MEKRIYLNNLYDYYKELFTLKQQEYFEDYYYNNLSLSEIAQNNDISRNAVHNQLRIVENRLNEFEKILGLCDKKIKINDLLRNKIADELLSEINEIL